MIAECTLRRNASNNVRIQSSPSSSSTVRLTDYPYLLPNNTRIRKRIFSPPSHSRTSQSSSSSTLPSLEIFPNKSAQRLLVISLVAIYCIGLTSGSVAELNVHNTKLGWIVGKWRSEFSGKIVWPTVPTMTYGEELVIGIAPQAKTTKAQFFNYSARAWSHSTKDHFHDEWGFMTVDSNGNATLMTTGNNGFTTYEVGKVGTNKLVLTLKDIGRISFSRDLPVEDLRRTFIRHDDTYLEQILEMRTATHPKTGYLEHTRVIYAKMMNGWNSSITATVVDGAIVPLSWLSTCIFIALAVAVKWRDQGSDVCGFPSFHSKINAILVGCVASAFVAFRWAVGANSWLQVLQLLWFRIFDVTAIRVIVLLFWLLCFVGSIAYCGVSNFAITRKTTGFANSNIRQSEEPHASTTQRKFFHLTASLVAISGLILESNLLVLAAHLTLQIFLIVETLRALDVEPWAAALNGWLLFFIDEAQESRRLVLTPIFLLIGIFMPVFFGDFSSPKSSIVLRQLHFAGIQSVGIGDSFAAIVGSWFARQERHANDSSGRQGPTKWTQISQWANPHKSLEGSAAMLFSQLAFMPLIYLVSRVAFAATMTGVFAPCSATALVLSSALATLVEAHVSVADNLLLPLTTMAVYYLVT